MSVVYVGISGNNKTSGHNDGGGVITSPVLALEVEWNELLWKREIRNINTNRTVNLFQEPYSIAMYSG